MATNQSTEKILKFIQEQENPVSKTEIVESCSLPSASVRECLDLLSRFDKIELISNGKVTLVRIKNQVVTNGISN
jgi:DNA-binding IclR family transcriptional regulator